jgi:hypothetical protein
VLNKTPPDVPSGVVIAVQLLSTLQALELITIPIILMSEPTPAVTTSLAGICRCNVVHVDTVFFSLVFNVALKFTERPLLKL